MVNHAVKGNLAKLLATEDLIVEHKKCDTASFDVNRRVLTLPLWQKADEFTYDMLVAHEVGHALFTPNEDPKIKVPHQYINVTEDARIEKLMKRRYAGLPKTFYRGYQALQEIDFFGIGDSDPNEMGFADRVNLYFKIGAYLSISFTEGEQEIVDAVDKAETFDEAVEAAYAMWQYAKDNQEKKKKKEKEPTNQQQSEGNSSQQTTESFDQGDGESPSDEQSEEESTEQTNERPNDEGGGTDAGDSLDVRTADNLEDAIKKLSENSLSGDPSYIEIPKCDLKSLVVKASEFHDYIEDFWRKEGEIRGYTEEEQFYETDKDFQRYKRDAQREVNYLVKEFECKKAASAYARTGTSKSGVLDTTKLHTYKYQDDLFKRVTITPDGKNHGLIFVLDWSGSMHDQMMSTLKQLFNLVWFCKKVSIPFEVYAFTNEWQARHFDRVSETWNPLPTKHFPEQEGYLNISENFSMMNILSSTTKTKEFDNHIKNMFRIGKAIAVYNTYYNTPFTLPPRASLSGTPLNEAIASLHSIIPDFMSRNKIEKMHTVILTDGEACNSTRLVKVKRRYGDQEEYMGTRSIHNNTILRCRKSGTTYPIPMEFYNVTGVFLKNLSDCFLGMNLIGFRILPNREFRTWVRRMQKPDSAEAMKVWTKNKSISFSDVCGYAEMIGISSNALEVSKEFDPVENATKAQILASFKKSYGGKKTNKKILSKFVSVIA